MTPRLVQAGKVLGIDCLDHLILTQAYYSFKDQGLL